MSKAGDGWAFAELLANYRLLPAAINQIAAVVIPWCEVTSGILIFLNLWIRASCLLAAALFVAFGGAVASALLRGLDIECGCFGTGSGGRVTLRLFLVDLAGLGLALFLFQRETRVPDPASR
jgi:hypothetical protein